MNKENLIVLRVYDSVNEAEWDRSLLEGEGVWSMIRNEIMSTLSHGRYTCTTRRPP